MAKVDSVKEEIGRLKMLFVLSVVNFVPLTIWLVQTYVIDGSSHPDSLFWSAFMIWILLLLSMTRLLTTKW